MKILLISGHGAGDSGAVSIFGKEADLTIIQVKKIQAALAGYADVDLYPVERNAYSDVKNGCLKVNFADYDYILEVHFNACVNDRTGDGYTTGTEIFVTKAEATVGVETKIVANIAALGFKNRGVKRSDFCVIRTAKAAGVSSALVEVCFIDDKDDMTVYKAKEDQVSQAIANGIISGFKLTKGQAQEQTAKKINEACKNAAEFLNKIAALCQADYKKHKILPSLSIAQAFLESGIGTSDLFMYGSAAFGIKASGGWTGKVFRKSSREVFNGTTVFQESDFRAYNNLAESVEDHGEFLQKPRYKAVVGETDFAKAAAAIKAAGYATDPEYVAKLTKIYKEHNLAKYDSVVDSGVQDGQEGVEIASCGFSTGDTVTIKNGAVYGGLSNTRGKVVPGAQCGSKKHTIANIAVNNGVIEAKLKEINSWVAVASLVKVTKKAVAVGSKVTIKAGAVYGGLSSTRGKAVPAAQCGSKKHTVSKLATNNGVMEARLKEINSWVAVASLNVV